MAKKKKKAATGKARGKKLSVKKRPVKDLDASKARGAKGGLARPETVQHIKFNPGVISVRSVGDAFQKLG
jgi:hypothetical protein